eukprot:4335440-Amphidinium_carterae.1
MVYVLPVTGCMPVHMLLHPMATKCDEDRMSRYPVDAWCSERALRSPKPIKTPKKTQFHN